jgi:hypothetical protein
MLQKTLGLYHHGAKICIPIPPKAISSLAQFYYCKFNIELPIECRTLKKHVGRTC